MRLAQARSPCGRLSTIQWSSWTNLEQPKVSLARACCSCMWMGTRMFEVATICTLASSTPYRST